MLFKVTVNNWGKGKKKHVVFAGVAHTAAVQEIVDGMNDPDIKQQLIQNTEASVARGTFGSPTFFVGDDIYFGKDSLRDVEAVLQQ